MPGRRPGAWERAQDFTAGRALRGLGRQWYQVKSLLLTFLQKSKRTKKKASPIGEAFWLGMRESNSHK